MVCFAFNYRESGRLYFAVYVLVLGTFSGLNVIDENFRPSALVNRITGIGNLGNFDAFLSCEGSQ